MDAKTLITLWFIFGVAGSVVNNFLRISGLTRIVVVNGGNTTRIVGGCGFMLAVVSWGIFIYTLMFHGDVIIRIINLISSG